MTILEDEAPLWRRILLNELFLAFVAAVVILWVAFSFATGPSEEEQAEPKPAKASVRGR
jgi:hypothetical protein